MRESHVEWALGAKVFRPFQSLRKKPLYLVRHWSEQLSDISAELGLPTPDFACRRTGARTLSLSEGQMAPDRPL